MSDSNPNISILITDSQLIVRSWDAWLSYATGIKSEQACGQKLTTIIPDLETRGLLQRFQQVLREGVIETLAPTFHHYLIPCSPLKPSGHFEYMQQWVTISPLRENSRIVGTVVTIEDVTARLERERDLAKQLASSNEDERLRAAQLLTTEKEPEDEQTLVKAMGDESWRVRRQMVDGLALRGGKETTATLLRTLREQHRNVGVLNSVLQVMALSKTDTISALIECLNDPDEDLRIYAALTLGEQQDIRAIPALIKALADPNVNVQYHAIDALSQLRAVEAVDALTALAESGNFFVAFPAIEALRRIGNPAGAHRLVHLLEDKMLRQPAAKALGELGDEEIVAKLVNFLNLGTVPVQLLATILATLYQRYEKLYREGNQIADIVNQTITPSGTQNLLQALRENNELSHSVLILSWLEGEAVERAITQLLNNPTTRELAVTTLVRYGTRVSKFLIEQLQAEDLETRRAAVFTLGKIGDTRAVPALTALLKTDPELVVTSAEALAQIGDNRAFESLLSLIGSRESAVRTAAIAALNSIGHPDMESRIITYLGDLDALVRESAVQISGYFAFDRCVDLVLAACHDTAENVRRAAVEHIAYLEDERVLPLIAAALQNDTAKVRSVAARALEQMDREQAFPLLLTALNDSDAWVRYYTARSIGRHRYPEALEPLATLAQSDVANQVRAAAIEALGHIGGDKAVMLLASFASATDADRDLAYTAISALGETKQPSALPPLRAVLHSPVPLLRVAASRALGKCGGAGVAETLQWVAAADTEPLVVQAAIDALLQSLLQSNANTVVLQKNRSHGTYAPAAVAALIDLTAEPTRREACVTALARLGVGHLEWLARALSHPDAQVRGAVIDALTRIKHPQASAILTTALEDPESSVRLAAVTALGYLGNRYAERKLISMVRSDPDTAVRRAAQKILQM